MTDASSTPVQNVKSGPQAKADTATVAENALILIDVMANDLAGNGKSLWSLNQGNPGAQTLSGAVVVLDSGARVWFDGQKVAYSQGSAFDYLGSGQSAQDVFTYAIRMGNGVVSYTTVTVTVTGTNDGPIAVADVAAGTENQTLTVDVLANDTDADGGHVFTLVSASAPSGKGTTSVVNNKLVFNPGAAFDHLAAGVTETVVVTYTMKDDQGATSTSTVTITITGTNDAPIAVADIAAGTENQTLTVDVLANDTDVDDNHVFTLTSVAAPAGKGAATIVGNKLVFTPGAAFDHLAAGATEVVTLSYTMKDDQGAVSTSTVTVTITGTNDGPIAVADTAAGTENQTLTVDVLANDTDLDDNHSFTLTGVSAPSGKGSATVVNNKLVFNPGAAFDHLAAGVTETVVVTYTMKDDQGATSTSTVTLTITGTNDGPVAVADTAATTENSAVTIDVLANDTDVDDNHVFTLTSVAAPSGKGVASIVNNQLVFTPGAAFDHLAAGVTEVVTLTYSMKDDQGAVSSSTVTLTVTGTNDGPIAVADTAAGTENQTLTVDVLANDTDLDDGHVFTLTSATAPAGKGVASVVDNKLVFTPGTNFDHLAAGATETVTVSYAMKDDQGAESVSTLTITITGTNDAPVAVADTAAGTENQTLTIDVLANDTDVDDGHTFTVLGASAPEGKGLAAVVNNRVVFAPGTDFDHLAAGVTETVTLTYLMTDEHGATSASTVTVTVTGTNDAPVAGFDEAATTENAALTIDVLANDTDVDDGHVLTVTGALVQPGQGSIAVVANQLVFTPGTAFDHLAAGDTATVTVFYSIKDDKGAQSAATVTITVTGTNDAPVAVADTAAGTENQVLTVDVLANDTDLDDGHVFTLATAAAPSGKGVASVVNNQLVFTPGSDFDHLAIGVTEVVTLSYTMQDEHGATSTSTVTVTITGTNDAPVAVADTAAGTENQTLTIDVLANDTDLDDGHAFTLTSATAPAGKGVVSVVNNQLVFTPGTNFDHLAAGAIEVVTVSYAMKDDQGAESTSTLTITITGTNDAPIAVADTAAGTENETLTVDVLANDTDLDDGHVFTLTSATAPSGKGVASIVDNKLVFTPGTNFDHLAAGATETVTVSYAMKDDQGAESVSTLTITITGTNDAPIAVADTAAGTENETLTIDVLANDTDLDDGHVFTLTSVTAPSDKGVASIVDNKLVFTPGTNFDHLAAGAIEVVTLSYTMQDDQGATSMSTVTVTITGTNDGPIAVADTAAGTENETLTVDVLANDTDLDDGHVFTLTSATAPSGKGVASVVDNKLVFTPGTNFDHLAAGATETVTVSYAMQDDQGATSTSTLTITITGTNDAPIAVADTAAGTENQTLTVDVLANDTDLDDGHVFTLTSATAPSGKGVASVVDNKLVFTPGTNFDHLAAGATETVTVSYAMKDDQGAESVSTLTVTITGTNDAPVAVADTAAGTENETLTVDVLANDTDLDDGHVFTLTAATAPSGKGVASIVDNKLVFTPGTNFDHLAAGATEVVTLSYTMQDEHGATSTSTVTVTITGTNDAPVAVADVASATEDGAVVTGTVAANDSDVDDGATRTFALNAPVAGLTFNADGSYSFNASNPAYQALAQGETQVVTGNYTVTDDKGATATSTLTITITGTNDAPVVTSNAAAAAGAVTEAGSTVAGTAAATGTLTSSDVDHNATAAWSGAANGTYGSFAIDATGHWTYTLDNSRPATEGLAAGQTVTETFTATVTDDRGATAQQVVTITVTGSEDNRAPVAADVTVSGSSGAAGASGVVVAPYYNGTGLVFGHLIDTNGDGVADTPENPEVLTGYGQRVATGDLDGDGDVDFVTINGNEVRSYTNVGDTDNDGTDNYTQAYLGTIYQSSEDIAVADLDGDGIAEVLVSSYGVLSEFTSHGDTNNNGLADDFTRRDVSNGSAGYGFGITTGDIDGDGRLDVISTNYENYYYGGAPITISFNRGDTDGDGQINYVTQQLYGSASQVMGVAIGDVNGDGIADIALSRWDGGGAQVMLGRGDTNGDGQADFETVDVYFSDHSRETNLADIDGDGDLDLISAGNNGYVHISINQGNVGNGQPQFVTTSYYLGYSTYGLAISDLDGDGDLDVLAANPNGYYSNQATTVLENRDVNGDGVSEFVMVQVTGIPGAWDAKSLGVTTGGRGAREDGPVVTGEFSGTDADAGETATLTFRIVTQPGEGTAINNNDGTFGFDPGTGFQDLAQGETRDVTFTYVAVDAHGAESDPATVTVTVAGTNDAPVVTSNSAAASGSVTEAGNLNDGTVAAGTATTGGTLTSSDVDHGATATWSAATTVNGTYGTFSIDPSGHWGYTLDNSRAATQALAAGATVTEQFTARVTDDKGGKAEQVVSVSVHGTNDSPVAVADVSGNGGGGGATPLGAPILVNTITQSYQGESAVTGLANGGFVVSYNSAGQFNGYQGIVLQRFDAAGAKVGTEIVVAGSYGNYAGNSAVTALDNGGFAVSWQQNGNGDNQDYDNTFVQLYNAQGVAVGSAIEVNSIVIGSQYEPSISALAGGGFIVTFSDNSAYYAGGNYYNYTDIRAQIFDANGAKVGGEFAVSDNVNGDQYRANVTTLASGGFVIVNNDSNNSQAGSAQLFTATGQRVGASFAIGDTSNGSQDYGFVATSLANGGFAVTFQSYRYDGSERYTDVHAIIFDANGNKVGSEIVVNTNYIGDQTEPAISALSDGSFVIVWQDNSAYYGNYPDYSRATDVKGQLVGADGTLVGAEFMVGTSPQGDQYQAAITTLAGGDIVVTWTDNSQQYGDNDGGAVVAQIYAFDKNDENEIVTIDVLKNDTDVDSGATFSLVSVTQPAKGWVSIVDNKIVFDPGTAFDHLAKNARETVSVTYVMQDEHGATSTTTTTIIVTGTNDAPVVSGVVSGTATENGSATTLDAFANVSDVDDGTTFTAVIGTLPAGVVYNSATHSFSLNTGNASLQSLAAGETRTITVNYGISDGVDVTPATAQWTVTGTYDAPVVNGVVSANVNEGGATSQLSALANVTAIDNGTVLSVTGVPGTLPAGVSYNATTKVFSFDPTNAAYDSLAQGTQTTVSVTYNVTDGTTTIADTVRWVVTGTNDAPVVSGPVTASVMEGGAAVALSALANASDVDAGTTLSVTGIGTLPAGVVYNATAKTFTFDPNNAAYNALKAGQTQVVTANYSVSDGFTSVATQAKWTVTGVSDAPAGTNTAVTVLEDGSATITTANFGYSDIEGDTFTGAIITTLPSAGTLRLNGVAVTAGQVISAAEIAAGHLVFTPAANGNGTGYANFTFQVQDNGGTANGGLDTDQSPNTMTFNVTAINDAPAGTDATVAFNEDTVLTLSVSNFGFSDATDGGANSLSAVKISTLSTAGTLKLNGTAVTAGQSISVAAINSGQLTFTPATNANGTGYASFTFQVQDNGGTANGGVDLDQSPNTLTINVNAVNDAPTWNLVANGDFESGSFVNNGNGWMTLANGATTIPGWAVTGAGGVDWSLADVSQGDLFIDLSGSGPGGVTQTVATVAGGIYQIDFDMAGNPAQGFTAQKTMTVSAGGTSQNFTFTNTSNDSLSAMHYAAQSMTFTAQSASTVLSFDSTTNGSVGPALDNVKLKLVGFATTEDTALSSTVRATDLDGDTLTYSLATNAAHGTVVVNANGNFVYTPTANYAGADSFQIQVSDGHGGVATQTFSVSVGAVSDAPVGVDRTITATEDTALTLTTANFAFTDVEGNALASVKINTVPGAGSLTLNGVAVTAGQVVSAVDIAAGKLVFTPATNANGTGYANFTFQVQDNGGTANGGADTDQSPNTMTINVTAVNDAVTDVSLSATTAPENVPSIVVGLLSATDADTGDTFTYSIRPGFDGSLFTIVGNELRVGGTGLDYEQAGTRQVTIRVTDAAGSFFDRTFTVQVLDSNEFTMTTANDTFASGGTNDQVLANSLTLNPGDRITTGGGADELLLFGQGTFNLGSLTAYSGVETVRLINLTTGTATLSLRAGVQNDVVASGTGATSVTLNDLASTVTLSDGADTVTLGTGTATVNTGSGNDIVNHFGGAATINTGVFNDTIYLGNGLAVVNAGADQDSIFIDQNGFNAAQQIDGGQGSDTLYVNGTRDLTDATLTNLETLNLQGSANATMTAAQVAQLSQITGSVTARLTIEDAAIDLSNKSVTNVTIYSANATGTVFTVNSAAAAMQIAGGAGNDTVVLTGAALTADQRDVLFAVTSIETLIDSSGTYTAPAAVPGLIRLTTGTDTLPATPDSLTVNATAATLNTGDVLAAGNTGTDILAIYGTGTFNMNSYNATGFEEIRLINNTSTQASVTLRSSDAVTFTATGTGSVFVQTGNAASVVTTSSASDNVYGYGPSTISTGAGGDQILLGNGQSTVNAGDDNDQVYYDWLGFNAAQSLNGGNGYDYLNINGARDLTGATIQNFESLQVSNATKMTAAQIAQFQSLGGGGRISVGDAVLDLTNKSVNVAISSDNATGTTFKVNSAAAALQIVGGNGNDTIDASTITLSAGDRSAIFAVASVETIIDATGTYVAPALPAGTIKLTVGADTLPATPDSLTVNANASTLGSGDNLNAGNTGTDVLALYGTGQFYLGNPTTLTGFEQVTLTNNGSQIAYIYFRTGMVTNFAASGSQGAYVYTQDAASTITMGSAGDYIYMQGSGAVTANTGGGNDVVYTGTGLLTLDLGDGNDTLQDNNGFNLGNSVNGGLGSDYIQFYNSRDLTGTSITGFEYLYLGNASATLKMTNAQASQFQQLYGANGAKVSTSDAVFDIAGKYTSGMSFLSENATGTTFKVSGSAQAFQIVGGAGQDIVENTGTALTSDQRTALLNGASVEVLQEGNTFHGGSGANSIVGNAAANTIYGNAGDDTVDGGAGADILYGGDGNDTFVFRAGETNGDSILDFAGNGALAGDSLSFYGFGTAAAGATFVQLDATHWQVNSADGTLHETITVSSGTTFNAADITFNAGSSSSLTMMSVDSLGSADELALTSVDSLGDGSAVGVDDGGVGTVTSQSGGTAIVDQLATVTVASLIEGTPSTEATESLAPTPQLLTEPLGRPMLGGVHAEATAAAETLQGTAGDDVFVFHVGTADGDTVLDFSGFATGGGDKIEFVGFGHDAIFTQVDDTHWMVQSTVAGQHEVITFEPGIAINAQDFAFV